MKSDVHAGRENGGGCGQPDSDRPSRSAPSVRLARTGAEIAGGAKSLGSAMVAAGYSEWTARTPTANGVTVGRALQAAASLAPSVGHSLRSHGRKADKVIDRTLTIKGDELPDSLQVQTAIAVKKLEQDADEPPETGNAARHRWRQRRLLSKAFAAGIRCTARLGPDAALATLQGIVERDQTRFPFPVEFVAVAAPEWTMARARAREAKSTRTED